MSVDSQKPGASSPAMPVSPISPRDVPGLLQFPYEQKMRFVVELLGEIEDELEASGEAARLAENEPIPPEVLRTLEERCARLDSEFDQPLTLEETLGRARAKLEAFRQAQAEP